MQLWHMAHLSARLNLTRSRASPASSLFALINVELARAMAFYMVNRRRNDDGVCDEANGGVTATRQSRTRGLGPFWRGIRIGHGGPFRPHMAPGGGGGEQGCVQESAQQGLWPPGPDYIIPPVELASRGRGSARGWFQLPSPMGSAIPSCEEALLARRGLGFSQPLLTAERLVDHHDNEEITMMNSYSQSSVSGP
ncbi:hypothetical protein N658DRAFT_44016 [Parathielavia hyrcaniae]|uniref:Uncharacterized protein n=1 Tax=Parathielavia hyrcaniae TaxID=113614 RepID=A0AAN6Q1S8_9PEZI|nr:hypothetical protein N658DRAFT_44016 [Parathielavia hyrcaniae]